MTEIGFLILIFGGILFPPLAIMGIILIIAGLLSSGNRNLEDINRKMSHNNQVQREESNKIIAKQQEQIDELIGILKGEVVPTKQTEQLQEPPEPPKRTLDEESPQSSDAESDDRKIRIMLYSFIGVMILATFVVVAIRIKKF